MGKGIVGRSHPSPSPEWASINPSICEKQRDRWRPWFQVDPTSQYGATKSGASIASIFTTIQQL
jgi:hypothetical protein